MSLTEPLYLPASQGIVMPKKRLSIIEQKTKSKQCLTHKEYEDFTSYIVYYLHEMVNTNTYTIEYKESLQTIYNNHDASFLEMSSYDDISQERWLVQVNEAHQYIIDNIDNIFKNHYRSNNIFIDITPEHIEHNVQLQIEVVSYNINDLDTCFKTCSREEEIERIKNHYSSADLKTSKDFITWQIMKALMFFTVSNSETKMVTREKTEKLLYRFIHDINCQKDETLMSDFAKILPLLWY